MSKKSRLTVDKVRASRDGHEFHVAWAARKSLQLVGPADDLVGIAVEGLEPGDQARASANTVEIADVALYYGKRPRFQTARSTIVVQLKYSVGSEAKPFRASDAKKTIKKFAAAYRDYKKNYGARVVERKLSFELVTNRPILPELTEALQRLASGAKMKGTIRTQANQVQAACKLGERVVRQFASKVRIVGLAGSLIRNQQLITRRLADWSPARDSNARGAMERLSAVLREKAGTRGQGRNVVTKLDVLDALGLQGPEDLLPCEAAFATVGPVVAREQLHTVTELIPALTRPLLIHAAGGVGKTVFLQSLASQLGGSHKTVLFDCFGGGAYRAPEDARHQPRRGLAHIANQLALDGLCDPIIPWPGSGEDYIRCFRSRMKQAIDTIRREESGRDLLLFLDAADNAATHAKDRGEHAFPTLLLESFAHSGGIDGVKLVVSCRTHRRSVVLGTASAEVEQFELQPFTSRESDAYVTARVAGVTTLELQVAYARSEGNPRILEYLVGERGLLEPSEIDNKIELDELIRSRIAKALAEARTKGHADRDLDAFLAGLAVLPPPVPVSEYADAHGLHPSEVESFAADLNPLLERTRHGLLFRDEPTETLVREGYAANAAALNALAENLSKKQAQSVYAAVALPGLLRKISDGKRLFDLAFDKRFPAAITSAVGKQRLRYARLKAAVGHAALHEEYDHLVHLLVELSTLAAINERGVAYLSEHPDLVVAARDRDAERRLSEIRPAWPGMRHGRLAIVHTLNGFTGEASRHAAQATEWIRHFFEQSDDYRRERSGPKRLDAAAGPLCFIALGRPGHAARAMEQWRDWYAFEVSEVLATLLAQAQSTLVIPGSSVGSYVNALRSTGALAGVLAFHELDEQSRQVTVKALAASRGGKGPVDLNTSYQGDRGRRLEDGLLKAAVVAVKSNYNAEASTILEMAKNERPRLWSFVQPLGGLDVYRFLTGAAIRAHIESRAIEERTVLPQELVALGERIPAGVTGEEFRRELRAQLDAVATAERSLPGAKRSLTNDSLREAERFIGERLDALVEWTRCLTKILCAPGGVADEAFQELVGRWAKLAKSTEGRVYRSDPSFFWSLLGRQLVTFTVWARGDLSSASIQVCVRTVTNDTAEPPDVLIELATRLGRRPETHEAAGRLALGASTLVEHEDDVAGRASSYGALSRAILPASSEDAAAFFRLGLDQMDAIGSGDHAFVNELLLFAARTDGSDLPESDIHTLGNICELNMPSEEEKFPWQAFAAALSRVGGCRVLARLGRWADREKISLNYTLLPLLNSLIEHDRVEPAIALALLRLASSVEFHECGTPEFASVMERKAASDSPVLLRELIGQYRRNHPGVMMASSISKLAEVAARQLGAGAEESLRLEAAAPLYRRVIDEGNELRNSPSVLDAGTREAREREDDEAMEALAGSTNPLDEASLSRAVAALLSRGFPYGLKGKLFELLRGKVGFSERGEYLRHVARVDGLQLSWKLDELKECRARWGDASASLDEVLRELAPTLVRLHVDDLVSFDRLSGSSLRELSEVTGVGVLRLSLMLVEQFAEPEVHVPSSVWIGLAAELTGQASTGEGRTALANLLSTGAARLASAVADGEWRAGLYPAEKPVAIAAGLVWLCLGSPSADERWRAAHSLRCFARLGKWEVVDAVVAMVGREDAHPFQAPELPFFFLNARLWLLIALARLATDYPTRIAGYASVLRPFALGSDMPHVVMRHFAAKALLACVEGGGLALAANELEQLRCINQSRWPVQEERPGHRETFYDRRPAEAPKPASEFHLDYDFAKHDVEALSGCFHKPHWETVDEISAWVHKWAPTVTSMYDSGGRAGRRRDSGEYMDPRYQNHGQQLGWHALMVVAGECLAKHPVVRRAYDSGDPWEEWLRRQLLTRRDGLWLADGVDDTPLDSQVNLGERNGDGVVGITGDSARLLALVGLGAGEPSIERELVVGGEWSSDDGIRVHVTSALAPAGRGEELALEASNEDGFRASLPVAQQHEDEEVYVGSDDEPLEPWTVWPSREVRLDGTDLLGAASVAGRIRFTPEVVALCGLMPGDPFGREWKRTDGTVWARSQAWGSIRPYRSEEPPEGNRLVCRKELLGDVLANRRAELVLLVRLRRYEKGYGDKESQYWHTTAAIRVKPDLSVDFYKGLVNRPHK
jgi:hypothetical protein